MTADALAKARKLMWMNYVCLLAVQFIMLFATLYTMSLPIGTMKDPFITARGISTILFVMYLGGTLYYVARIRKLLAEIRMLAVVRDITEGD